MSHIKTPFKIRGWEISFNEEFNRPCVHIPLQWAVIDGEANDYRTEQGVIAIPKGNYNHNPIAIQITCDLIAYLKAEGFVKSHEELCFDYTDMFCPSCPISY